MARNNWEDDYTQEILDRVYNRDYTNGGADAALLSDEDYARVLKNQSLWNDADEAGRAALHDATEKIRAGYDYSGGGAGNEYIRLGQTGGEIGGFSYATAPQYVNRYQDLLDQLTSEYVNRDPFAYDYQTDPRWQAYKKEYTREGRRSSEDTLGQYAAMTGGTPSTAAMTAAQQAGNYYNAQMTDKIPELYQLAYDMYLGEGDRMLQQMNAVQSREQSDYDRYLDQLGQYNKQTQWDYQTQQDADEKAYDAAKTAAGLGDWSLLERYYGLEPGTLQALYDAQNSAQYGSGGSGYPQEQETEESVPERAAADAGWTANPINLGLGPLSDAGLQALEESGRVESGTLGDTDFYRRTGADGRKQWLTGLSEEPSERVQRAISGPGDSTTVTNRHADSWVTVTGLGGRYTWQELYEMVENGEVKETYDPDKDTLTYTVIRK